MICKGSFYILKFGLLQIYCLQIFYAYSIGCLFILFVFFAALLSLTGLLTLPSYSLHNDQGSIWAKSDYVIHLRITYHWISTEKKKARVFSVFLSLCNQPLTPHLCSHSVSAVLAVSLFHDHSGVLLPSEACPCVSPVSGNALFHIHMVHFLTSLWSLLKNVGFSGYPV